MDINTERIDNRLIITPKGRMDAYGALKLDKVLENLIQDRDTAVIFDLDGVSYLSSGGIRSLLQVEQKMRARDGQIKLCNVNRYPLEVLKMAGFDQIFPIYQTRDEALEHPTTIEDSPSDDWIGALEYEDENVILTIKEVSPDDSRLKVVGDIYKVLYAQLGEEDVYSRKFSETEYSIGLGGLGETSQDFFEIMGEMITIGGTMVWLPTDKHDTPDFLIPATDTGMITIHTGFNVALDGDFHDIIVMESKKDRGISIDELYSSLFKMSREKRPSFKGIISIAMQADIGGLYRSGVKISPVKKFAPQNREMIMHPDNLKSWMNIGTDPLYAGETLVSFGVGVDLKTDLSSFDEKVLGSLFYMHPANISDQTMLLHNHAVVFKHLPLEKGIDLDSKIKHIIREGEFLDMQHLLDNTRIKKALIGASYIQDIIFEKEHE